MTAPGSNYRGQIWLCYRVDWRLGLSILRKNTRKQHLQNFVLSEVSLRLCFSVSRRFEVTCRFKIQWSMMDV